jgi:hypothetical protein
MIVRVLPTMAARAGIGSQYQSREEREIDWHPGRELV